MARKAGKRSRLAAGEANSAKNAQALRKGTIVIPAPHEVDALMSRVPKGKRTTISRIAEALARRHSTTIGCPITTHRHL
jgi:hypothetical protein